MLGWYRGDGLYSDGEFFRFDYYNGFVIHPALMDILALLRQKDAQFEPAYKTVLLRSRRYAEIQERLIAQDGTFPRLDARFAIVSAHSKRWRKSRCSTSCVTA